MNRRNIKTVEYKEWTEVEKNKRHLNRKKMTKTKFCNKTFCNRDNCDFAHSFEEIRCINCNFNDTCRQVFLKDCVLINKSKLNICKYKHICETKQQYLERINYNINDNFLLETTKENIFEDINKLIEKDIKYFKVKILE